MDKLERQMQQKGRAPHKQVVGVVWPVTGQSIRMLGDYEVVEYRPEDIPSSQLLECKVKILILGGSYIPLKSVLPALRAAAPNLPVVAISDALDRQSINFYHNHVDALSELPGDAGRLASAIVSEETIDKSICLSRALERLRNFGVVAVVLLSLWWLSVALFRPAPYLLPSPTGVALALFSHLDQFAAHMAATAFEALLGFFIGNVSGIAIAILLHRDTRLQKFTLPVLISFQAIPIVALAPLLVVWLGTGLVSKIAMAAIICFFPMVVNTLQAFSNIDRDYAELFEFYRADFSAKLRMLLMPASFPAIVAALKISAGLAVVGAIVAELTGADKGLGYVLLNATYRLETDLLFVAMLLSGLLGMAFYQMPALLRFIVPQSWKASLK
jgi:ABC-type nitrate/sulfonate/bicarbonate transport system permease component